MFLTVRIEEGNNLRGSGVVIKRGDGIDGETHIV